MFTESRNLSPFARHLLDISIRQQGGAAMRIFVIILVVAFFLAPLYFAALAWQGYSDSAVRANPGTNLNLRRLVRAMRNGRADTPSSDTSRALGSSSSDLLAYARAQATANN